MGIYNSIFYLREVYKSRDSAYIPKPRRKYQKYDLKARAAQMRANPTWIEQQLGMLLRRILGEAHASKLRSQSIIRGYIADFYIPEWGLVFEADGAQHKSYEMLRHDNQRDLKFKLQGIDTHRFTAGELRDLRAAHERLSGILSASMRIDRARAEKLSRAKVSKESTVHKKSPNGM